jgi:hypothetical protein
MLGRAELMLLKPSARAAMDHGEQFRCAEESEPLDEARTACSGTRSAGAFGQDYVNPLARRDDFQM